MIVLLVVLEVVSLVYVVLLACFDSFVSLDLFLRHATSRQKRSRVFLFDTRCMRCLRDLGDPLTHVAARYLSTLAKTPRPGLATLLFSSLSVP